MSGLWCTALGYSNEELVEAAAEQMGKLPFAHLFSGRSHDPAIELAETLKELMPVPTSKIFFTSSGSEANDAQIKLLWYMNNALGRPRKKKIIGRRKGYHGVTVATASLTGLPANHTDWDLPIPGFLHAACPHHYRGAEAGESEEAFSERLAAELEAQILAEDPETVAAFFVEPVMGAGGAIVPPAGYFAAIQPVLERYDVRLVADEVICGFGRLGTWFGSEALGIRPHTLSFAKALTSGYLPLGGISIDEPLSTAPCSTRASSSAASATAPPIPGIRSPARWPTARSTSTGATASSSAPPRRPRISRPGSRRSPTIRSSARPAGSA